MMGPTGRLLDLACGDGYLLERARTVFPDATLSGIDMSEAELALARDRLTPHRCQLWHGHADALPVPDGSQDAVTCHMALMLMTDLDRVLAEIRRVLRPQGRLLAVLSGRREQQTGIYADFLTGLTAVPGFADRVIALGDRRLRTAEACREALAAAGFTLWRYEPLPVRFRLPPGQEWALFGEMYTDDWLTSAETAALRDRVVEAMREARQADGSVIVEIGLTAMTAIRQP